MGGGVETKPSLVGIASIWLIWAGRLLENFVSEPRLPSTPTTNEFEGSLGIQYFATIGFLLVILARFCRRAIARCTPILSLPVSFSISLVFATRGSFPPIRAASFLLLRYF